MKEKTPRRVNDRGELHARYFPEILNKFLHSQEKNLN